MRFLIFCVFALFVQSVAHAQEVDFCDGVTYTAKDCTDDVCSGYEVASNKWFSCMNQCQRANKKINDANDAQRRCQREKKDADAQERRKQLENERQAKKAKADTYSATDEERGRVSERMDAVKKKRYQQDKAYIEQQEQLAAEEARERKREKIAERRKAKENEAASRKLIETGRSLLEGRNNPSATYEGSGGSSGCGGGPNGGCR